MHRLAFGPFAFAREKGDAALGTKDSGALENNGRSGLIDWHSEQESRKLDLAAAVCRAILEKAR